MGNASYYLEFSETNRVIGIYFLIDSYKNLSENRFLLHDSSLKIPGNTKHYLEFYRLVLVVGQCLVYRGSIGKDASTLRSCSTFSPLIGGGMEVVILPPSLPSG